MPVVRVSWTTFFSLDPSGPAAARVPSVTLVSVCFCSRLLSIFVRGSRVPTSRPDSDVLVSRRSTVDWLSVREDLSVPPAGRSPRDALLSPSRLSVRELDSSLGKRRLSACCLTEVETDGVLLVIKSPMRERDWSLFGPELTAEGLPACCSFLETRERRSELRVWESGRAVSREPAGVESLGVLLPIRPPIRDLASLGIVRLTLSVGAGPCACPGPPRGVAPTAPAWPLPAMPDCAAVGADGLVVAGTPIVEWSDLSDLSDLVVIGLPIREVRSELIRPLEFVFPAWLPALRPDLVSRTSCPRFEGGTPPTRLEDGG